jgi:Methylamine utilisation protein MauE
LEGIRIAVLVTLSVILMWSGLEKARTPHALGTALRMIGLPRRRALATAILVPGLELSVVAMTVAGMQIVPAVVVILLAASFAIAGIVALVSGTTVPCPCFGAASKGYLGWRQVAALPLWGVGAWAAWNPRIGNLDARLIAFTTGISILTAARAAVAVRAGISARQDRRAMAGA